MSECFTQYAVADFEYETSSGGVLFPICKPLCLVVHLLDENLRHTRTIRLWREQLLAARTVPFDIGSDTLLVAYSAWAELTCFIALGWPFPCHVLDLHTSYLYVSNILDPFDFEEDAKRKKPGKGLIQACRAYGIPGWENIEKKTMSADIGEGHWQRYGQAAVFAYCEEDTRVTAALLRAMVRGTSRRAHPCRTDHLVVRVQRQVRSSNTE
jgi:DNA polymerase-1